MKFAVIETGGKQYRVTPGQVLEVEKLPVGVGEQINFDQVLMVGEEGSDVGLQIGMPTVAGATVSAELVENGRQDKIVIIHFKAKTRQRKKAGHRQLYSKVKILDIKP
ncbi:MAG: 50S ribosomal protein L21 [Patescibacteria group bacterium]